MEIKLTEEQEQLIAELVIKKIIKDPDMYLDMDKIGKAMTDMICERLNPSTVMEGSNWILGSNPNPMPCDVHQVAPHPPGCMCPQCSATGPSVSYKLATKISPEES